MIGYVLVGLGIGAILGYLFARLKHSATPPLPTEGISTQLAELKTQFAEVEKRREEVESQRKAHEKEVAEEREKRLKEWMDGTQKFFEEQTKNRDELEKKREEQLGQLKEYDLKTAEEKEKRLKEWMDGTEKFFEEQGKNRDELEKKRDAMMRDMNAQIASFTRTVTGTSTRGRMGESILAEALSTSIQAGFVATNLETGSGPVEFAWDLENGRYVPIDSKFPDLLEEVQTYTESDDPKEQLKLKKSIATKLKSEVKRFQKYLHQENTVETGILVVPEIVLTINPDVVSQAFQKKVFVCSYWNVIPLAYTLERHYRSLEDDGDLGKYRQLTTTLFSLFDVVSDKVSTIDRGLTMITNAKEEIADQVHLARRERSAAPNGDDES
jgi:DNA recombination protein RmuC